MKPVIELKNVTKMYGTSRGIENVSLEVEKGAIFGFLGPNGSGKTTTISLLVDLIRPTSGQINVFGLDSVAKSLEIRRRIGYLAGDFALDRGLTGWQLLEYFGNLRGDFNKRYVNELAESLQCDLSRKFKTLSRGNKQKVGLISALMHQPELLIFDEPTSGLDPLVQAEFNKIIGEHKKRGNTAFISSHVLSEIQEICDHVAFVREGSVVAVEHMVDIAATSPKRIRVISPEKNLDKVLADLQGMTILYCKSGVTEATYQGKTDLLLSLLAKHRVNDLTIQEADLETIFMKYYKGGSNA